jgi:DMSO/TMAO reductase YedYZ molybdopterin-dependent catalytic subunit
VFRRRADRPRAITVSRGSAVLIIAAFALFLSLPARCQSPPTSGGATLRITGKVDKPLMMNEADLQALSRTNMAVTDEKGDHVTYDGVPIVELLRHAGVPLGKQLKGPLMRLYVIVKAADGYQAVFALSEFDPGFTERVIILADRRDGKPLPPPEGPFRLVVAGEKRHARWVREVTTLDVEQAP